MGLPIPTSQSEGREGCGGYGRMLAQQQQHRNVCRNTSTYLSAYGSARSSRTVSLSSVTCSNPTLPHLSRPQSLPESLPSTETESQPCPGAVLKIGRSQSESCHWTGKGRTRSCSLPAHGRAPSFLLLRQNGREESPPKPRPGMLQSVVPLSLRAPSLLSGGQAESLQWWRLQRHFPAGQKLSKKEKNLEEDSGL